MSPTQHTPSPQPCASKAGKLGLAENSSAATALSAIIQHHLKHLQANAAVAWAGTDPEGVHQMRVALRNLRACLSVYKAALPKDCDQALRAALIALSSVLGQARDLDVFYDTVQQLAQHSSDTAHLKKLRHALKRAKHARYQALRSALGDPGYAELIQTLSDWPAQAQIQQIPALQQAARLFASAYFEQQWTRLQKKQPDFLTLSAAKRHQIRIACKKMAYGIGFFRALFDSTTVAEYLSRLSCLRDDLGLLNDAEIATQILLDLNLSDSRAAYFIQGSNAARRVDVLGRIQANWTAFLAQPKFWGDA